MGFLALLLVIVFVVASILLVVIVLVQDEQGEGLGGLFGGGSSTAFGARSGNVLTKFTSILAAIFLACAFGLAWANKTPESGDVLGAARRSAGQDKVIEEWWEAESDQEGLSVSPVDELEDAEMGSEQ